MNNPRIIAGSARGIRLEMVPGDITRPITDRVKEALFNIIGGDILDSSFLDLFAGTGSVGIEALSRGARFVKFLDISPTATRIIRQNLEKTKLSSRGEVLTVDTFTFLKTQINESFDYIFIAPPQYKNIWIKVLNILDTNPSILNNDGWIIVQIDPLEMENLVLTKFNLFNKRRYGNTLLLFYFKE